MSTSQRKHGRRVWTAVEDAKLIGCVNKYGAMDWSTIVERTGLSRGANSCYQRWNRMKQAGLLSPDIDNRAVELQPSPREVGSQGISISPIVLQSSEASAISEASAEKLSCNEKPQDEIASSLPQPSKKQKVSEDFSEKSIEYLSAVSGINLEEEIEQLFSAPKSERCESDASHKAVQEEERLILQKVPLQKKLAEKMAKFGLTNYSNDVEQCLSQAVEERLRDLISKLIRVSKQRMDSEKSRHTTVVTSDVRAQILAINQKSREELESKQAKPEKLQPDSDALVDADKENDEGLAKSLKEIDKMRTAAANAAARAAVGGDDMLSRWQLMAEARLKREGGSEIATSSQAGENATNEHFTTSLGNVWETQGAGKRDPSFHQPPSRVTPGIFVKDMIAVLEKDPQLANSTILYRLYDKMDADPASE